MASTIISIEHEDPINLEGRTGKQEVLTRIINYLNGVRLGTKRATELAIKANATENLTAATGTIEVTSCAAGTVIEVNGVEFIAIASGTPVTANGEFVISGTNDADAASLAAAINASTNNKIVGVLTASVLTNDVTITAVEDGQKGNAITLKTKGVCASGTITAAAVDTSDTFTINGVEFIGIVQRATGTLTADAAVAGNTFAIAGHTFTGAEGAVTLGAPTFSVDTGDNETATSIAAQINAFSGLTGRVTATSAAAVVTVRAVDAGTAGNSITLTGTALRLAASGSGTLAGGIAVANNQFDTSPGTTNAQSATDMARAINASTTALVTGVVVARANAAVVTVRSKHPGVAGNEVTLASSDGTDLAVSGARLTGGTEASSGGAQATGTVTVTGADAGNYTVLINGVTTGNVAGTNENDNATAASIGAAINGLTDALVAGVVSATVADNVITITADDGGIEGNAITLSCTGTGAVANVARLAGGAAPTTVVVSGERLTGGTGGNVTEVTVAL